MDKKVEEDSQSISKAIGNLKIVNAYFYENKNGLVLDLRFDEGQGNIAYDTSGNENDGELLDANTTNADGNTPPQWVDGVIGKALEFDGVDDYIEVEDDNSLDLISFTLEAWIIVNTYDKYPLSAIIAKSSAGLDISGKNVNYALGMNSTGYAGIAFEESNGADHGISTISVISKDKWIYIAGTYSYDIGIFRIYINGKLDNEKYEGSYLPETNNQSVGIGSGILDGLPGFYFNGTIDEVRIYNRALSPDEIQNLFFRIHLTIYNPTTLPINLNNTNAMYVIEDPESGKTICSIPLIYNKTFITKSHKTIIYPKKQDTIKLALIYENKVCHLEREHDYNVCLVYQGKKTCGMFRVV